MSHISFYPSGHHFRDEVSLLYSNVERLVEQAYGDNFVYMFEWDQSGREVGYLSNMTVVYVWTLLENLMRNAYIYAFSNINECLDEDKIRKNNSGWGQMSKWLTSIGPLNDKLSNDLKGFEPVIGELDARRNCLVHCNGIVDQQYKQQVTKYNGKHYFKLGHAIWTDWEYHKQLKKQLISFQMLLEGRLEKHISSL
jgi:hypothetical protein